MRLGDLERDEKLVLVAFVKLLIPADGKFSEGERRTLDAIAVDLTHTSFSAKNETSPYREAALEVKTTDGREILAELLAECGQRFPDEDAVKAAAREVSSAEVRQLIYGALHDLARHETIAPAEARQLDWLEGIWFSK